MKKKMIIFMLSVIILAEIICIAGICVCKGQDKGTSEITIRDIPPQTVLYKICRGAYYEVNEAINELYDIAELKGMLPCGPVSTCLLNSPLSETYEHWIVEIQIPVESYAIEYTGTLGFMTDVKTVPQMKVAVAVKPEGITNPTKIISNLFSWINENDYIILGRMRQSVLYGDKGDYSKLKTEFMIPIDAMPNSNRLTLTLDPCYM